MAVEETHLFFTVAARIALAVYAKVTFDAARALAANAKS